MGEAFSYEVNGGENLTDHWLTPPELIKAAGLSLSEWIRAPMRSSPGRRPRRCTSCPSRTACCFPGKAACSAIHRMAPRSRSGRAGWRCTDNGLLLVFAFPKTDPITLEDKQVELFTKLGQIEIKKKFNLKLMVFHGKLEL